jgi:transcriptional regulator with XRE-family HTH domain
MVDKISHNEHVDVFDSSELPRFGGYVRKWRNAHKVSLRKAADVIGIPYQNLSEIERGRQWPFSPERFGALIELLPSMTRVELEALYLLEQIERLKMNGHLDGLNLLQLLVAPIPIDYVNLKYPESK